MAKDRKLIIVGDSAFAEIAYEYFTHDSPFEVVAFAVTIGDNVVLWSGNHIGHHSTIIDPCFVSSHVVVSGFCSVGKNCFMVVNSTVANNLTIGNNCVVGAGALILSDVPDDMVAVGMWKKKKEQPA